MSEQTGLEKQEAQVEKTLFGNPTGLNSSDKSMLEMSDTNRLIYSARQSQLELGVVLLHGALVAHDNRKPEYKIVTDPQTGDRYKVPKIKDHWQWLKDIDYLVRTNQLTIKGYSRAQYLRQSAPMAGIAEGEELANPGILERFFGR